MDSKALDYVCIFTGGSIRGGAYVGALRAMNELGVKNKCYVGSSVGAVIGVFHSVGYNADELEEIVNEFNFELFKDINLSFNKDFSISRGEYFYEWVKEKIEKKFYGKKYKKGENLPVTFNDIEQDIVILTTDLYTTKAKIFSKQETPHFEIAKAVRISSGMPGLLKATEHNGQLLVDGDLSRSWPIWKIIPSLFDYNCRMLEFRLEGSKERFQIENTADYLNSVYTAFSNFAADHVISTYQDRDKFDYIRLDAGNVNITDFNLSKEGKKYLYAIGYNTTIDFFTKKLPQKRLLILPHYEKILVALKETKTYFENSKYILAKNRLAELFVIISKSRRIIDNAYYEEILEFYEKFMNNLFVAFAIVSIIKDKNKLLKTLNTIIIDLENKVSEIKEFINTDLINH